jgi:glycerol-3-phosphate acyltransferase PlsY
VAVLKAILIVLAGYALGSLSAGYYLVRWRTGRDIRDHGSGSTGSRNVGRLLGKRGFALTLAVDCLKGVAAVGVARLAGLTDAGLMLTMLAAVVGHVWPVQLGFRGGKGVATALGAMAAYSPAITVVCVALFAICYVAVPKLVLCGVAVVAAAPLVMAQLNEPSVRLAGLAAVTAVVAVAHRDNFRRSMREGGEARARPTDSGRGKGTA